MCVCVRRVFVALQSGMLSPFLTLLSISQEMVSFFFVPLFSCILSGPICSLFLLLTGARRSLVLFLFYFLSRIVVSIETKQPPMRQWLALRHMYGAAEHSSLHCKKSKTNTHGKLFFSRNALISTTQTHTHGHRSTKLSDLLFAIKWSEGKKWTYA